MVCNGIMFQLTIKKEKNITSEIIHKQYVFYLNKGMSHSCIRSKKRLRYEKQSKARNREKE